MLMWKCVLTTQTCFLCFLMPIHILGTIFRIWDRDAGIRKIFYSLIISSCILTRVLRTDISHLRMEFAKVGNLFSTWSLISLISFFPLLPCISMNFVICSHSTTFVEGPQDHPRVWWLSRKDLEDSTCSHSETLQCKIRKGERQMGQKAYKKGKWGKKLIRN